MNSIRRQIKTNNQVIIWDIFNDNDKSIEVRTQKDNKDVFLTILRKDIKTITHISSRFKMRINAI